MALVELFLAGGCLILLFIFGWIFLQQSLYKELDDSETLIQACANLKFLPHSWTLETASHKTDRLVVQGIFSLVFALSVNLVQLILFEILGLLSYR